MSSGRSAARRAGSAGGGAAWRWRQMSPDRRLAAYAAAGLFLTLFLPWYQETVIAPGTGKLLSASASITGWGAFSFVEAAVLLVAVGVLTLLFTRAGGRAFHLPGGDGFVIMAAGFWTSVLVIWRIFDKQGTSGHAQFATTSGIEWGIFVALAVAALLAYAGSRIRAAHQPEPPLPGEDDPRGFDRSDPRPPAPSAPSRPAEPDRSQRRPRRSAADEAPPAGAAYDDRAETPPPRRPRGIASAPARPYGDPASPRQSGSSSPPRQSAGSSPPRQSAGSSPPRQSAAGAPARPSGERPVGWLTAKPQTEPSGPDAPTVRRAGPAPDAPNVRRATPAPDPDVPEEWPVSEFPGRIPKSEPKFPKPVPAANPPTNETRVDPRRRPAGPADDQLTIPLDSDD